MKERKLDKFSTSLLLNLSARAESRPSKPIRFKIYPAELVSIDDGAWGRDWGWDKVALWPSL